MQPTAKVNQEPNPYSNDNQKSPRRSLSLEEIAASELARHRLQAESLKEIVNSAIEKAQANFLEGQATINALTAQMTAIIGSNAGDNINNMRG